MYTPCFQGCSSHLASYVIHEPPSSLISDTILIPVVVTLSRPITAIERLPARSKLPRLPPYFALDNFLRFDSRVTFRHLPRCCRPDSQPCIGPFSRDTHPFSLISTMEFSRKECRLHHDDLKQKKQRHQCNGSTTSRRSTKTENTR